MVYGARCMVHLVQWYTHADPFYQRFLTPMSTDHPQSLYASLTVSVYVSVYVSLYVSLHVFVCTGQGREGYHEHFQTAKVGTQ